MYDDLLVWLPLTDREGPARDHSGNGNHGTHNNTKRGVAGVGGLGACGFDGSTSEIVVTDLNLSSNFSVAMFARIPPGRNGSLAGDANTGSGWFLTADDSSAFWGFNDGDSNAQGSGGTPKEWDHYAAVFRDGTEELYINGNLVSEQGNRFVVDAGAFAVGSANGGNFLKGAISDFRLYGRAISPDEVQTLYDYGVVDTARPPGASDGGALHFKFDGSFADSFNNNTGANNGASFTNSEIRGQSAVFNGSSNYVSYPAIDLTTGYTISTFNRFETPSDGNFDRVIGHETGGQVVIRDDGAGNVVFFHGTSGGFVQVGSEPIPKGEFFHSALTWDESTVTAYINGLPIASASIGELSNPGTGNAIGYSEASSDEYFDGEVDEVRIYTRALDPTEIMELFQFGTQGRDLRPHLAQGRP